MTDEDTKRVLVTGANKGIGLAIVEAVLEQRPDTMVLLGSRGAARGEAARRGLVQTHPEWGDRIEVLELDVASEASVAAAAARVRHRFDAVETPLYGVVNNAGMGANEATLRQVFDVNTLGMRRVCEAFIPLLRPGHGRIVNITSASGPNFVSTCSPERQRFFLDQSLTWPQLEAFIEDCCATEGSEAFAAKGLSDGDAYGLSKACANTCTLVLAREHPELKVNACTPGWIATDLTKPYASAAGKSQEDMGMKPPSAGTRAPLHLLFGELEGTGRYYGSDALRSPLDRYRDPGTPAYTGD